MPNASCDKAQEEDFDKRLMEDEIDHQFKQIQTLREGIKEIYAMRGEDEFISQRCNELLDKTKTGLFG